MGPDRRKGVSGYLEVFILAAVAVGGSGIVFGAATGYLGSLSGPSLSLSSASIKQGNFAAIESVTVSDLGTSALGSFVITTSQAPVAAGYCFSLESPENGTVLSTTCPSTAGDPGSVSVGVSVRPGSGVEVVLLITGGSFALGSAHQISVTASSGAQASTEAQVVPG